MNRLTPLLVLLVLAAPARAQDLLWKCQDPERPFRYATTEESRDEQTPPCREWLEMRGRNLAAILEAAGTSRYSAANAFLAAAANASDLAYPGASAGMPATTSQLYEDPTRFGFRIAELDRASPGSLVIYNGLGGILVEVRASQGEPWSQRVLYPSATRDFELAVADLAIPGMGPPKILVGEGQ